MRSERIRNAPNGDCMDRTPVNVGGTVSDLSTGAYAPGTLSSEDPSKARHVAGQSKEAATQAASEVKDTAAQQAQRVGAEAKTQVRNVASDVRDKVGEQARTQNDKLVGSIRQTADHLDEMRGDRTDSPAATVVSRVADGGRQLADYLDRNGPEGVLQEVQDFARRRPGAFLATALVAGFVVGRLGKSVAKADPNAGAPSTGTGEAFVSSTPQTYPTPSSDVPAASSADFATTPTGAGADYTGTGTEYAATGTGTPLAVEDPYSYQEPRP
jgi:hypothetical protein